METFFIWLVLAKSPGTVELWALPQPYPTAQACIDATVCVLDDFQTQLPRSRGALCWTIDEMSQANYKGAIDGRMVVDVDERGAVSWADAQSIQHRCEGRGRRSLLSSHNSDYRTRGGCFL